MKLFEKLSEFFSLASDFFRLDLPEEDDDILWLSVVYKFVFTLSPWF